MKDRWRCRSRIGDGRRTSPGSGHGTVTGQEARDGGFTDAAGAGKKVSVSHAALGERVHESFRDGLLADEVFEALRSVFTGENEIAH